MLHGNSNQPLDVYQMSSPKSQDTYYIYIHRIYRQTKTTKQKHGKKKILSFCFNMMFCCAFVLSFRPFLRPAWFTPPGAGQRRQGWKVAQQVAQTPGAAPVHRGWVNLLEQKDPRGKFRLFRVWFVRWFFLFWFSGHEFFGFWLVPGVSRFNPSWNVNKNNKYNAHVSTASFWHAIA